MAAEPSRNSSDIAFRDAPAGRLPSYLGILNGLEAKGVYSTYTPYLLDIMYAPTEKRGYLPRTASEVKS